MRSYFLRTHEGDAYPLKLSIGSPGSEYRRLVGVRLDLPLGKLFCPLALPSFGVLLSIAKRLLKGAKQRKPESSELGLLGRPRRKPCKLLPPGDLPLSYCVPWHGLRWPAINPRDGVAHAQP
jgi:hypothetical protein